MARPTLATHPKFFRLAALVGGRLIARGALELIWDSAYASGDAVIGDAATVEAVIDWRGKPGELAAALVTSGFLDALDGGALAVHDLEDHEPDYVRKRRLREEERRGRRRPDRSVTGQCPPLSAVVRPPSPSPSPSPNTQSSLSARARSEGTDVQGGEPRGTAVPPSEAVPAAPQRSTQSGRQAAAEPDGVGPRLWPAATWYQRFSAAWCQRYGRIAYGGGAADAKATGALSDTLAALPDAERTAAQDRASEMFAEFLRDEAPKTIGARHPWGFFVTAWNGLRVGRTVRPDPRCDWHRKAGTNNRKARYPSKACPECKHIDAMNGTRESEPATIADMLKATKPATAEELAEIARMNRRKGPNVPG